MIGPKRIALAKRTKLSKNFSLWEVIRSNHTKLIKWPGSYVQANLRLGAEMILQPIRNYFGPIRVNSGYRNPAINKAVKGSKYSDHLKGGAFDIVCLSKSPDRTPQKVFDWIGQNYDVYYRQVILYRKSGFVHVSFNYPGQRFKMQQLTFNK